jgi:Type II secretion system protein C
MKRVSWPKLLLLGGSTVLSWLAGTNPSPSVQPNNLSQDVTVVTRLPVPVRLQDWRGPSTVVVRPERNVFTFREPARATSTKSSESLAGVAATAPAPTLSIPFKLIGMAQDQGESAIAIIAGHGQVFFVKEGDVVPPTYAVGSVAADSVELTDGTTGAMIRLFMK